MPPGMSVSNLRVRVGTSARVVVGARLWSWMSTSNRSPLAPASCSGQVRAQRPAPQPAALRRGLGGGSRPRDAHANRYGWLGGTRCSGNDQQREMRPAVARSLSPAAMYAPSDDKYDNGQGIGCARCRRRSTCIPSWTTRVYFGVVQAILGSQKRPQHLFNQAILEGVSAESMGCFAVRVSQPKPVAVAKAAKATRSASHQCTATRAQTF